MLSRKGECRLCQCFFYYPEEGKKRASAPISSTEMLLDMALYHANNQRSTVDEADEYPI